MHCFHPQIVEGILSIFATEIAVLCLRALASVLRGDLGQGQATAPMRIIGWFFALRIIGWVFAL